MTGTPTSQSRERDARENAKGRLRRRFLWESTFLCDGKVALGGEDADVVLVQGRWLSTRLTRLTRHPRIAWECTHQEREHKT